MDLPPAAEGYPPIHASDPQSVDNCWWAPFVSNKFGLEAAVQTCAKKSETSLVTETETGLQWQTQPDDGQVQKSEFVTILSKPATQPIEAAIREQLILKLKVPAARTSCKVVSGSGNGPSQDKNAGLGNSSPQIYTVKATGAYAKLKKFNNDEESEIACPGLESDDATAVFFQYNPSESKTKFLYFHEDDNGTVLNSGSIHFLREP